MNSTKYGYHKMDGSNRENYGTQQHSIVKNFKIPAKMSDSFNIW